MLRHLIFRLVFTLGLVLVPPVAAARAEVTVYCAASLVDLMGALAARFEVATGERVRIVAGASSTLARQIAAGAPADIFISANKEWINHAVTEAGFGDIVPFVHNRLVIVAPNDSRAEVDLTDLPRLLDGHRLALGDPSHVPAGIYAKQALEAAGVWDAVANHLAPAGDVRAAVALVARGAAPYGIVYATDALRDDVRIVGEIDPALHEPIIYYLARNAEPASGTEAFISALGSEQGRTIIAASGFQPAAGETP